jgi:hypothetical protein
MLPLHRPLDAGGASRCRSKHSQGGLGEALLAPPRGALVIPSTSSKGCALPTKLAVIVRVYPATKIAVDLNECARPTPDPRPSCTPDQMAYNNRPFCGQVGHPCCGAGLGIEQPIARICVRLAPLVQVFRHSSPCYPSQTASKSSLPQCGNKLTVFPHFISP